jgi:ActR/RegA family two-component response regulator
VVVVSIIDERAKGIALGAAEYLVKPIGRDDLLQALERIRVLDPAPLHEKEVGLDGAP